MKLKTEFYKLPLRFDADRLIEEAGAFAEDEWRAHPQGFEGNTALILVSAHGGQNDDMEGPMQPTDKLGRCPYFRQILASFETVIGRSRLMRLAPGAEVNEHTDIHYYWHHRVRVHIPIVTDPSVRFWCDDKDVHMAAGEAWAFDNWKQHSVVNPSEVTRIHLVFDTTGSAAFWELVKRSERPFDPEHGIGTEPQLVPYRPGASPPFATERFNAPVVMSPAEADAMLTDLADDLRAARRRKSVRVETFIELLDTFRHEWRAAWSVHGTDRAGWPAYRSLIEQTLEKAAKIPGDLKVASNGMPAIGVLNARLGAALNPKLEASSVTVPAAAAAAPAGRAGRPAFERPVFIVAGPRSGSTLVFETLARNRDLWTIGGESHGEFEGIASLNPANNGYHSNRLTEADADPATAEALIGSFEAKLVDSNGNRLAEYTADRRPGAIRFLEKTPKNALRIPFLRAVFPDALFIFLHRNPRDGIASIIEAWRSGNFVTYPELPRWSGPPWSLLLPPGWRSLNGAKLEEIAAFQWKVANQQILDDLAELPDDQWCAVGFDDFLDDTAGQVRRLCEFAGVPFGQRMQALTAGELPRSRYTLTPPDAEKWRKNEKEVQAVLSGVGDVEQQLREL